MWSGTFWSHAVASTPIPDLKLQISAWQQFMANDMRLEQVRGLPPEMAPSTACEFVKALKEAGYQWLLVQEHSVERMDGSPLQRSQCFVPNRLVARNSQGETISITALIKTQGSDTKLVGQMQPYTEALGCERQSLGASEVPSLVSQIADGENGGVMMNEFPEAFRQANRRIRDNPNGTAAINGSEYIEALERSGVDPSEFPSIQACTNTGSGLNLETMPLLMTSNAITRLSAADAGFNMEGASGPTTSAGSRATPCAGPDDQLSAKFQALFDQAIAREPSVTCTEAYQVLLHVLLLKPVVFDTGGKAPGPATRRSTPRQPLLARGRHASQLRTKAERLYRALHSCNVAELATPWATTQLRSWPWWGWHRADSCLCLP